MLGHAAIAQGGARRSAWRPASTAPNRVIFKQLLQAEAIDFCQIDSCRLGGVNENLAVILMAAKFGVPVCPHAGGVGLCELVQHLSMFDYIAVSGRMDDRVTEFVDHLHEHFVDPGRDPPRPLHGADARPATAARSKPESRAAYRYPGRAGVEGVCGARRDMRRLCAANRVPHDCADDGVRADRDIQLALVDGDAEGHAPLPAAPQRAATSKRSSA